MSSNNSKGADNQQERLKIIGWIVGFTDGEGCFSISIFKNKTSKFGWQVMPEFVITQSPSSKSVLEAIKDYFNCGNIYINRRYDNHREHVYRYCVRSRIDLVEKIIPFFNKHSLLTQKKQDFDLFCRVIELMQQKEHLKLGGLKKIAALVGKQLT